MTKQLSEMTIEELWEIFPIILSKHRICWSEWYQEEEKLIKKFIKLPNICINHIGSTAIKGIDAKPIIDILLEIPTEVSMDEVKKTLIDNGYICMSEMKNRKSFNKGYTNKGFAEKVFHLHLRYLGDHDELYFRDLLNDNPGIAKEYEALKIILKEKYEHNRDGYTAAKAEFVQKYTKQAKEVYGVNEGCYGGEL